MKTFNDKLETVINYLNELEWMTSSDVDLMVDKFISNSNAQIMDSRISAQFEQLYFEALNN